MSFRFTGLVPAFALLAAGAAYAQPASTGGGGSMAFPDSLPSGQVHAAPPSGRDTGSMAQHTPSGGVTTTVQPRGRNAKTAAAAPADAAPSSNPASGAADAPTPAGRAAAAAMALRPSTAPVPYTDFSGRAAMPGKSMPVRRHMPAHRMRPATASAAPAPAPAAGSATPAAK